MSQDRSTVFEFGEFVLDTNRAALIRSGANLNLRPQTFEVLSMLVRRRGSLVTRDELLNAVWHEAPVTDDSLTQCIVEIRKALGDRDRTIVRTVPRRGFVFDPTAAAPSGEAGDDAGRIKFGPAARRWSGFAASAIALIAVGWLALSQLTPRDVPPPVTTAPLSSPSPGSIAVLPFVDMSESQDQAHFGDGIAEEILLKLGEYPDLVTIGGSSSFQFRDRHSDVVTIGKKLGVAWVLDGSIRRSGPRLRIGVQLLETANGAQVWSDSFDRELTAGNLLDIQAEVAASVAEAVVQGAVASVRESPSGLTAASTDAYELYLQGMFYLHRIRMAESSVLDADPYDAAIETLEAAISQDPDWAPPHLAIARVMILRAGSLQDQDMDTPEAFDWYRLAKRHLLEALTLDPDYALAYSSLGHVLHRLDFDFAAAEDAFLRARELGDSNSWLYAMFLARVGRYDESIEQYRLAIERDPLLVGPRHQLATVYRCAGRYADSILQIKEVLRLAPARDDLYLPLAYLYLKTGKIDEGRSLFEQYADPESESIRNGPIYVLLGMSDRAYEVMAEAEADERWWLEEVVATGLLLGERERLLDYLEAAAADDPRRLLNILSIDGIQSLRNDARFRQILRQAGFPDSVI